MGLEKGERKSQPEIYESNSEGTDQQKQGIELIQVITKELRLDFVPPPPFLLILPKKTNKKTYLGSGRMKHNRRDWTTLKKETPKKKKTKKKTHKKTTHRGQYDTTTQYLTRQIVPLSMHYT